MALSFLETREAEGTGRRFVLRGQDKSFFFSREGVTVALPARTGTVQPVAYGSRADSQRWNARLEFVGSSGNVAPQGKLPTGGTVSYFTGARTSWRAGLRTFTRLTYSQLWPGVDLSYSATSDQLKYEFVVAPGADPGKIRLAYRGIESLRVTPEGALEVATPVGSFRDARPIAYQERDGKRISVQASFALNGERDGTSGYQFKVGNYDPRLPLVIDPSTFVYCGFLGGTEDDFISDVAVDGDGAAYVVGTTKSLDASFPAVVGPDTDRNEQPHTYVPFVAKIRPDGTGLEYCGYIGDGGFGYSIAVDSQGCAYVGGTTGSNDPSFPAIGGPDVTPNGEQEGFIAKVRADGTGLIYCGYIGGSGEDSVVGVAIDGANRAYVTGRAWSSQATFPVKVGPDLTYAGNGDNYVARVRADGSGLEYCGYIGGSGYDTITAIAVDDQGAAYVVGETGDGNGGFPLRVGPDLSSNGSWDVFVAKVAATGATLEYCGLIGGSDYDIPSDVAVWNRRAYVVGEVRSSEGTFPVKKGPDLTYNGNIDGFIARVSVPGHQLEYCSYIGGGGIDQANGVAVDADGSAYVVGRTDGDERSFPARVGPDLTFNGQRDAFITKVTPSGSEFTYSGFLGGAQVDLARKVAVDDQGAAYIVGETGSAAATFPVRGGPSLQFQGAVDGFVAKVSPNPDVTRGPDLTGSWTSVKWSSSGRGAAKRIKLRGSFTLRNRGTTRAGSSGLRLYLSSDPVPDSSDILLKAASIPPLRSGQKRKISFNKRLPSGLATRGRYLLGVVDSTGAVDELNEENNVILRGPLTR